MTLLEAIFFGLIQGITEFIPVSSSGHLSLLGQIFKTDPDAMFTLSAWVHMGTLIAVFIVMRREIMDILRDIFGPMTWKIAVATVPTVIMALLLQSKLSEIFGGEFLGYSFLLTGIFLLLIVLFGQQKARDGQNTGDQSAHTREKNITAVKTKTDNNETTDDARQDRPQATVADDDEAASESEISVGGRKDVGYKEALFAGIGQAIAILPGVSRSGSTLTAMLIAKVDREKAIRFSFLMSIPAIIGGFVFDLKDLIQGEGAAIATLGVGNLIVGVLASAISGYLAMAWMLRRLKGKAFMVCAIYVLILGVLVLIDQNFTQLIFNR